MLLFHLSKINGQTVHISEDFEQPFWPEYFDQDTLLFKRSTQFATSNSSTLEKHEYQLKIPIHPNILLTKIQQLQKPELIQKFSSLQKDLHKTVPNQGYFHIRFSSEINLSSVNRFALIFRDSLNRELKVNWGNTKDQLEVHFLGNLIYSGSPFQYNISGLSQNVFVEFDFDSLRIFTFSEEELPQNPIEFSQNLHAIEIPINSNFHTPEWAIISITQSGKTAINSHKIHQINWGWGDNYIDTIATQINQISNNEIQFNIYSKNYFSFSQKMKFQSSPTNKYTYLFPLSTIQFNAFNSAINSQPYPPHHFKKITTYTIHFTRDSNTSRVIEPLDSTLIAFDSITVTMLIPLEINTIIYNSDHSNFSKDSSQIECHTTITHLDTVEPDNIYISELLTDPEPHFGRIPPLPYVELVNQSNKELNLETIYISKNSEPNSTIQIGYRIPLNSFKPNDLNGNPSSWRYKNRLPSKTHALIVNSKDTSEWCIWFTNSPNKDLNDVFLISCPALPRFNFSEGSVYVFDQMGRTISTINYSDLMQSPEFKEGGISLEIINSNQPYSWELNAKSNSNFGGSPGTPNSIDTTNFPIQSQVIQYKITDAFCSEDSIYLIWNHNLPITWPSIKLLEYRSDSDIPVDSFLLHRRNNTLTVFSGDVKNNHPCTSQNTYYLDTNLLFTYLGSSTNSTIYNNLLKNQPIILHRGDSKNLRFNEILSNNFTGFSDFIELVNIDTISSVDLENWDLLYYDENRILKNIIPLKNEYFRYIAPSECKVFTDDRYSVYRQFPQFYPFNIAQSMRFPDIPNTTGIWVLNHHIFGIQDEINMTQLNKEFPNVSKGFSLEKIHPLLSSNRAENWFPFFGDTYRSNSKNPNLSIPQSGASPGEMNSNYHEVQSLNSDWLSLTNRILKFNHIEMLILPIEINLPVTGYSLSGAVYNSSGRQICTLELPQQLPQKASLFVNLPREIQFNGNYVIKFEATLLNHTTKRTIKRFTVLN